MIYVGLGLRVGSGVFKGVQIFYIYKVWSIYICFEMLLLLIINLICFLGRCFFFFILVQENFNFKCNFVFYFFLL